MRGQWGDLGCLWMNVLTVQWASSTYVLRCCFPVTIRGLVGPSTWLKWLLSITLRTTLPTFPSPLRLVLVITKPCVDSLHRNILLSLLCQIISNFLPTLRSVQITFFQLYFKKGSLYINETVSLPLLSCHFWLRSVCATKDWEKKGGKTFPQFPHIVLWHPLWHSDKSTAPPRSAEIHPSHLITGWNYRLSPVDGSRFWFSVLFRAIWMDYKLEWIWITSGSIHSIFYSSGEKEVYLCVCHGFYYYDLVEKHHLPRGTPTVIEWFYRSLLW